ncbi:MAG: hypothetical protein RL701_2530 [Pseudomonadota bacterium]
MTGSAQQSTSEELIAGRYRVQAELGRGGMARVLRVCDERTREQLALKQLLSDSEPSAALRAMFEREFRSLATLTHPHIVRAFDYGFDADARPYYTMELLDGCDVRELARESPPTVQRSCLILRDSAAALALIHSRRLVHRDIGPRNVWCTPDGRAKLIDFGTLVAMGAETRIAGTPPYVPPEAYYAQPLDARCDLFALGALAYFLFTGRHAFPARTLGELPALWAQRPQRPDALRPELPSALCDLVMALISVDARARPNSASEVYERLSSVAQLPIEDEPQAGQAFLSSPRLIAREHAHALLDKKLRRAHRGRGSCAALVAPAGLGRSRMLSTLVIEAKLTGACVVVVGAKTLGSEALALATALVEGLFVARPEAVSSCADLTGLLAQLSPVLHAGLGAPELPAIAAHERERKLSGATLTLIERFSEQHCLVIAVDDLQRADSATLWLLGRISLLARDHRLLLVTTCAEAATSTAPPALLALTAERRRVALAAFTPAQTRELLESVFEDVPELDSASQWLHELSHGSPQACLQYAQYLVDAGAARYEGGRWRLPRELHTHGLPTSLGAMIEQRVAALSVDARLLALGLALARDASRAVWQPEVHVPIESLCQLLDEPEPQRAFSALAELQRATLLQERSGVYLLAQTAVEALVRLSDAATRQRLHGRLARIFELAPRWNWLNPRHCLLADDGERARRGVLEWSRKFESALADWGSMRLSLTAECGSGVLEHWRTHAGTPYEGILLRRVVLLVCSVYDWRLARFGEAQITQLLHDTGFQRWNEFTAPGQERVEHCLAHAERAYEQAPPEARGLAPREALQELGQSGLQLCGAFVNSHSVAQARALEQVLAPLAPHSALLGLIAAVCRISSERVRGLDFGERLSEVGIGGVFAAQELPHTLRVGAAGVHAHIQTVEDARRGRTRGFGLMDLIASVIGDDMFLIVHGRWLCHAFAGHAAEASALYKRVELITDDDVWRRRAYLFAEAELHALTGDLRSLTRVRELIEELARSFPGWLPWAHWARAEAQRIAGDLSAAQREVASGLAHIQPGEHRAWSRLAPSHAAITLALGDAPAALREAQQVVITVQQLDLDRSTQVEAERIVALAHAELRDHTQAQAAIERAVTLAAELEYAGLPLARLYETRSRIALSRGDVGACVAELVQLWPLIERADAPRFVAEYERLRQESARTQRIELPEARLAVGSTGWSEHDSLLPRLSASNEARDRRQHALTLLLDDCGSSAGYLFLRNGDGLFEAAVHAAISGDDMKALATRLFAAHLVPVSTATVTQDTGAFSAAARHARSPDGERELLPVLLSERDHDSLLMSGIALLAVDTAHLLSRSPRHELVRFVSRCLREAGDTIAVSVEAV